MANEEIHAKDRYQEEIKIGDFVVFNAGGVFKGVVENIKPRKIGWHRTHTLMVREILPGNVMSGGTINIKDSRTTVRV